MAPALLSMSSPIDDLTDSELIEIASEGLRDILDYIAGPDGAHVHPIATTRRLMAVLWVVRPDLVGGMSQSELAVSLGVTRSAISKMACEFSDLFNFRTSRQKLPSVREACKQAQIARQRLPITRQKLPTYTPPHKESFA